ncbi:MAG TPA: hypothetical protein VMA95_18370 [Streptosporangiaceae bacterium]|nr:hypothetical protein [Streptosporangiaceae bacterium]
MTETPGAGQGYQPAARLRPSGVGDILSGSFSLIRQNPGATIGLTAAGTAAGALAAIIVVLATRHTTASPLANDAAGFVLEAGIVAVSGAVIAAIGEGLLGRRITVREAIRRSRAGWVLLAWVTYSLMVAAIWGVCLLLLSGAGVLLSLPVTYWLGIMLCLIYPVVVLERRNNPFAAIGRSWRLVFGSFWRFFWTACLLGIVTVVLFIIAALFVTLVTGTGLALLFAHRKLENPGSVWLVTIIVFALVLVSLAAPMWLALVCQFYADARMRREGMDLMLRLPPWRDAQAGNEFAATARESPSWPASWPVT